jgi:hypothetical protein
MPAKGCRPVVASRAVDIGATKSAPLMPLYMATLASHFFKPCGSDVVPAGVSPVVIPVTPRGG